MSHATPHEIATEYAGNFTMDTKNAGGGDLPYCHPDSVIGRVQRMAEAYLAAEKIIAAARELPELFEVDGRTHSFVPLLDEFDFREQR